MLGPVSARYGPLDLRLNGVFDIGDHLATRLALTAERPRRPDPVRGATRPREHGHDARAADRDRHGARTPRRRFRRRPGRAARRALPRRSEGARRDRADRNRAGRGLPRRRVLPPPRGERERVLGRCAQPGARAGRRPRPRSRALAPGDPGRPRRADRRAGRGDRAPLGFPQLGGIARSRGLRSQGVDLADIAVRFGGSPQSLSVSGVTGGGPLGLVQRGRRVRRRPLGAARVLRRFLPAACALHRRISARAAPSAARSRY